MPEKGRIVCGVGVFLFLRRQWRVRVLRELLTNSTIPGQISTTADGRTRLDFVNPRPDEIDVLITAKRAS